MRTSTQHHSTKQPRRLVAYARVSTDEQAEHGVSLAAQEARLPTFIEAHGDRCVASFNDAASGAVKPERRPGLASALSLVSSGQADGIVVTKLDRISRSTIDTLQLLERAQREGWSIVSVAEHLDTSTAAGRFVVAVFAAAAEMERGLISERTRAAMKQIASAGRGRSRRLPFGYRLEGAPPLTEMPKGNRSKLIPEPQEQLILSRILRLHERGKGAHAIVSSLKRRGLKNPRTNRDWSVGGMRAILATATRGAR
jgi:DNA invertase Pin-like site-specific DNA recombinase